MATTQQINQATLGEVARRLDDVFNRFETMANDLPKSFVTKDLYEAYKEVAKAEHNALLIQMGSQTQRIAELEDDKKWLWRLVVGAVILALLGLLFSASHTFSGSSTHKSATSLGVTK